MKKQLQQNDEIISPNFKLQGLSSMNSFKVHPLAMSEHVACSHYLDKNQVRFLHLSLTQVTPLDPGRSESCMLFFLISGSCRVETSELDNPIEVQSGKMLFIPAGSCLKAFGAPEGECLLLRFTEFSFCENLTLQNLAQQIGSVMPEFTPYPIAPPLAAFLGNMIFYTDNQINCSHLQQIKQDECFILMRICYSKEMLARIFAPLLCDENLLLKMKIQRFAAQTHTISDLATRCKMTEITMKRKIRKLFGIPAYRWMLRQRNRQILFDLRSGRTPKEICFSYGYSSLSNFAAYCKRQFGLPPTQIIKLPQGEYTKLLQSINNESF